MTAWTGEALGHISGPGHSPLIAVALFLGGMGAAFGAYVLLGIRRDVLRRTIGIGLGVVAFGCFGLATAAPLIIHASPAVTRPSTAARLARIVSNTSLRLRPDEGHVHLYLDGSLVSMAALDARITAPPGRHTLRAEFVAVDHRPFRPEVVATVTFQVRP